MHDLDRAMFETETNENGGGELELEYETNGEYDDRAGRELELAAELLGVRSDAELEQFLGDLMRRATGGVAKFARSDTGKALGGILKSAAGQALPVLGRAAASAVDPSYAGYGERAGKAAGSLLGLELEGLSQEDRELETARGFVRFANSAVQQALKAPRNAPPAAVAKAAASAAARKFAPGLNITALAKHDGGGTAPAQSGRWERRGDHVVIYHV